MFVQVSLKCSTKVCFVILWFTGSQECQAAGRTLALLESHKVAYTEGWWHPVLNFVVHLILLSLQKYYSDHSIHKVPYIFLVEACHSGIVLRIASSGSLCPAGMLCFCQVQSSVAKSFNHYSWKEKACALWWSRPETSSITTILSIYQFQVTGKRRWCLEGSRWQQSSASISSI